MPELRSIISRYDAFVKDVRLNRYGYWSVTYSVAPGVDLTVTVARLGVSPEEAATLSADSLLTTTGQKVM